jgi:hypothetical protein
MAKSYYYQAYGGGQSHPYAYSDYDEIGGGPPPPPPAQQYQRRHGRENHSPQRHHHQHHQQRHPHRHGGFTLSLRRRKAQYGPDRSEVGICTKYTLFFENFILFVSTLYDYYEDYSDSANVVFVENVKK